jgi:hypothetical protein
MLIIGMAIATPTERPQSLLGNLLHTTTNQPTQHIQDTQLTPQLEPHHTTTTMVASAQLTQLQLSRHQPTRPQPTRLQPTQLQPTPTMQQPPTHTLTVIMAMATTTKGMQHTPTELVRGSLSLIELFKFSYKTYILQRI